jgi:hypothetical protein
MPRLTLLALWAWLGLLGLAAAQNPLDGRPLDRPDLALPPPPLPPPHPLPRDPELPPPPMALPPADGAWQYVPPAPTAPAPAEPAPDGASDERARHLLQAAEHLESAGLAEQAARLRQQAREQSLASLLARKLADFKKLQAEIEQLRQAAGGDRQVVLQVKIVEVSRAKVIEWSRYINPQGAVGSLVRFDPAAGKKALPIVIEDGEDLLGWQSDWAALEQARAVSVLSRPSITTLSGQPASVTIGRLLPLTVPAGNGQTAVELKQLGLSLEITPHVLSAKRLRLELRCRTDELDSTRDRTVGGQTLPGVRVREIDAAVEMSLGQTAVLACLEESEKAATGVRQTSTTGKDKKSDDKVTLVCVTPTLIGERIDNVPLPSPVAEKPETSWWDRLWRK